MTVSRLLSTGAAGAWRLFVIALSATIGLPALAQEQEPAMPSPPVAGVGDLPRDLSPWGMLLTADPLVQAVLIGLVFASVVTWTVWLAKTIELIVAGRGARRALRPLQSLGPLADPRPSL